MKTDLKNTAPVYLIALVLLAGAVFFLPNSIDLHIQRPLFFSLSLLLASGVYIMLSVDMILGGLIVYISLISGRSIFYAPMTFNTIFGLICFLLFIIKGKISEKNKGFFFDLLIFISCLNLACQILQAYHIYFYIYVNDDTLPGLMSNINETSALFAITAPAFWRKNRWFLAPVTLAGLALAHSYQGVVAYVVIAVIFFNRGLMKKKVSTPATVAVLLCAVFFFTVLKPFTITNYTTDRVNVWKVSIVAALVKPLTGWRFGQYSKVIPFISSWKYITQEEKDNYLRGIDDKNALNQAVNRVTNSDIAYLNSDRQRGRGDFFDKAHNEYVEFFFASGLIGLALGLAFISRILYTAYNQDDVIPFYGVLSSCIVSLFGFSWHLMPLSLMTVFYISLIKKEALENGRNFKICL